MRRNVQIQSVLFVAALLGLGASSSLAALGPIASQLPGPEEVQWDQLVSVGETEGIPRYDDEDTGLPVTVVTAGSAVRWFWDGDQAHSVTSGIAQPVGHDGEFNSGVRTANQEPENGGGLQAFIVTFSDPGVYKYYCEVHPSQHGVVIVA